MNNNTDIEKQTKKTNQIFFYFCNKNSHSNRNFSTFVKRIQT